MTDSDRTPPPALRHDRGRCHAGLLYAEFDRGRDWASDLASSTSCHLPMNRGCRPDHLAPATSEDETADVLVRRGRNVGATWIVGSVVLLGLCLVATTIVQGLLSLAGSAVLLAIGLRYGRDIGGRLAVSSATRPCSAPDGAAHPPIEAQPIAIMIASRTGHGAVGLPGLAGLSRIPSSCQTPTRAAFKPACARRRSPPRWRPVHVAALRRLGSLAARARSMSMCEPSSAESLRIDTLLSLTSTNPPWTAMSSTSPLSR